MLYYYINITICYSYRSDYEKNYGPQILCNIAERTSFTFQDAFNDYTLTEADGGLDPGAGGAGDGAGAGGDGDGDGDVPGDGGGGGPETI